jgi:tetratricopeptide (TPR) repeat protein
MALAPDLPEGHLALGYYYYYGFRDYSLARAHFSAALRTLSNDPRVLKGIFYVARRQGRWGEALEALETWQRSDPRGHVHQQATETFTLLRRYEEAYESMRRAIAIDPNDSVAYYFGVRKLSVVGWRNRASLAADRGCTGSALPSESFHAASLALLRPRLRNCSCNTEHAPPENFATFFQFVPSSLEECICLHELGQLKKARAACNEAERVLRRELAERPHDYRLWSSLGRALAILGRSDEAVRVARKSVEMVPLETDSIFGSHQMIELATVYAQVGEVDMSLALIDELLSIPSTLSVGLLRLDPAWDPLRDDPRFQALLEKYDQR